MGRKFNSKYTDRQVGEAQYLAELMCERFALSQKETLSEKFWNEPYWKKKFLAQVSHANKLLEGFSIDLILEILKHPDMRRVYSLGLKSVVVPLLEREQQKRLRQEKVHTNINEDLPKVNISEKPREAFGIKKNKRSMLDEL